MQMCKVLDLPTVPHIFLNECIDVVYEKTNFPMIQDLRTPDLINKHPITGETVLRDHDSESISQSYNLIDKPRTMEWFDGTIRPFCTIRKYPFSDQFVDWVRENIYSAIDDVIPYQLGHQIWKDGDVIWPHTDGRRGEFVLIYLLDEGGDDVRTNWYHAEGKDIVLTPSVHFFKFDKLTTKLSMRLPVGKWTLNDTRILHSVHYLTRPRISITIGLMSNEVDLLMAQHGFDFTK